MSLPLRPLRAAPVLIAIALVAGCGTQSRDPLAPSAGDHVTSSAAIEPGADMFGGGVPPDPGTPTRGFYPLQLGNSWSYIEGLDFQSFDLDGHLVETVVYDLNPIDHVLTGLGTLYGRTYVREEWRSHLYGNPATIFQVVFYRQDATGLYEADPPFTRTPRDRAIPAGAGAAHPSAAAIASALHGRVSAAALQRVLDRLDQVLDAAYGAGGLAGGALDHEITRLSYPLQRGSQWVIRADGNFVATAEAIEPVRTTSGRLFVGVRIRIDNDYLGPTDAVHVWYGRQGYLKLAAHLEFLSTDLDGNPNGTVVSNMRLDLVDLHLSPRREVPAPVLWR